MITASGLVSFLIAGVVTGFAAGAVGLVVSVLKR